MFKKIVFASLLVTLNGCAMQQTRSIPVVAETALSQGAATDVISQMVGMFPPAQTRLLVIRSADDAFGHALLSGLRARGYAVEESTRGHKPTRIKSDETDGLVFDYDIDQLTGSNFYQVLVKIGRTELSRAYVISGQTAYAGGQWVRRE